ARTVRPRRRVPMGRARCVRPGWRRWRDEAGVDAGAPRVPRLLRSSDGVHPGGRVPGAGAVLRVPGALRRERGHAAGAVRAAPLAAHGGRARDHDARDRGGAAHRHAGVAGGAADHGARPAAREVPGQRGRRADRAGRGGAGRAGRAQPPGRGRFGRLPWLLMVFVPAITMRAIAEERRTGTLEWLAAQPITELDLLLGKFLGNWFFVLTALAGTLPVALGVLIASDADGGVMLAQYVGAALLSAQLVAIGLFASSATRNQITAFVMALAMNFALILAGLPITTMGLPPRLADAVSRLAIFDHFEGITRGVVDLRDVLYFVSVAALFLGLAYLLLARER